MTGLGCGMRWMVGCIGLMLGIGAGPALSRDLPPHEVRFDLVAGQCNVFLDPTGTTGETPPRLWIGVGMTDGRFSLGIDGAAPVEAVLVRRGERAPFIPRAGMSAEGLLDDPLWSQLAAAPAADDDATTPASPESLYLTIKDMEGRYSSSRYDRLLKEDVLRLLLVACDAPGIDAPALTLPEHRLAERRLDLTDAETLLLRRHFAALYAEAGTDVGTDGTFTVTDRRHIARFNAEEGYPSGDYLWPAAIAELLDAAEDAVPPAPESAAPTPGGTVVATHGDWSVSREGSICRSATVAVGAEGLEEGLRMQFAVDRAGRGGMMAIDLVTPNPFRADMPLVASVDGQGYALAVEPASGAVIPRPQPDGSMTRELTLALRRGASVVIEGVSSVTGAPARVAFSAKGFSAAFAEMSKACDRMAVMGWIE